MPSAMCALCQIIVLLHNATANDRIRMNWIWNQIKPQKHIKQVLCGSPFDAGTADESTDKCHFLTEIH